MKRLLLGCCLFALCLWALPASAQISVCDPAAAPIAAFGLTSDGLVVGDDICLLDTEVTLDITHTWPGDMVISVTSPGGTVVGLFSDPGDNNGDFLDVTISDAGIAFDAIAAQTCACLMMPAGPGLMADFNGASSFGTWTLDIDDVVGGEGGTLNEWCVAADEARFCSAPAVAIPDPGFVSDSVVVGPSIVIGDLQVFTDITHPWLVDLTISVSSPAATSVTVLDSDGPIPGGGGILCTFADAGVPGGAGADYLCDCKIASTVDPLSSFSGESSSGTWTITVTDNVSFSAGTLNEWCVIACSTAPVLSVSGLTCSDAGGGAISYSGTAGSDYIAVDVLVNGALDSTLGPFSGGDPIVGTSAGTYATPQVAEICLVPIGPAGSPADPTCCSAAIFGLADVDICSTPGTVIAAGGSTTELEFVFTSIIIEDAVITADITTPFAGNSLVSMTSAAGSTVTLHSFGGSDLAIDVSWWQLGAPNLGSGYACGGCYMQPSGPGTMLDFVGEDSAPGGFGVWVFFVSNSGSFSGTVSLDEWCMRLYSTGPSYPVTDIDCTAGVAPGTIDATWTHTTAYDDVEILENGVLVASLGPAAIGTAGSYTSSFFGVTTAVEICVRGIKAGVTSAEACCNGLILGAVDSSACDAPAYLFDGPFPEVDTPFTVSVLDALTISEVEVFVDLTNTFAADYTQTISSPGGTVVALNVSGFGSGTNILVLWDESGAALGGADLGCACALNPEGDLTDFANEVSLGTWTLTVNPGFTVGTLNEWCVRIDGCTLGPPIDLTCDASGSDILAVWTETDTYDSVDVLLDGAIVASIGGGVGSYTIAGVADGRHTVQVSGASIAAGCAASSSVCRAAVGFLEECSESVALNDDTILSADDVISHVFVDSVYVGDVDVLLQFSTGFTGDDDFLLTSPVGTSVQLHNNTGSDPAFDLIWSDAGVANTGALGNYDCGGCSVMPSGPGSFADFFGELSDGSWDVTNIAFNGAAQSIDLVCVGLYEACLAPPSDVTCDSTGTDILVTWTEPGIYDIVDVLLDGGIAATIGGGVGSFTLTGVAVGRHTVQVIGTNIGLGCSAPSASCRSAVGFLEECFLGTITGGDVVSIAVADSIVIGDVDTLLQLETTFTSDWQFELSSPFGTTVRLHDNTGGTGAFDVIWSDAGAPNTGTPGLYDCGLCSIMPSGPGSFADFFGELSDGTWSVDTTESFGTVLGGTLCLGVYTGCTVLPPTGKTCTVVGSDILLEWSNGQPYDAIEITRNDVSIASLAGTATSYLDVGPAAGDYTYRVNASTIADACASGSALCSTLIGIVEACTAPALSIPDATSTTDILSVGDTLNLADLQVRIDIANTFVPYLDIDLLSPAGTSVRLYGGISGSDNSGLNATFGDAGATQDFTTDYNCGGSCLIAPSGPGSMADFVPELVTGDWTLTVLADFGPTTLNEWCLRMFEGCAAAAPTGLACTDNGFTVDLAWSLGETYDSQEVYEDGVLIATLSGTATSYSVAALPGNHSYQIRGMVDALSCGNFSDSCSVAFALQETCDSPALAIPDSGGGTVDATLVVSGALTIGDSQIRVDITHTWAGDVEIDVTSPAGSLVSLIEALGTDPLLPGVFVTFSDSGVPFDALTVDCSCVMRPSGPGAMSDFDGEAGDGTWTLTLEDHVGGDVGTLNEWCVGLYDVSPPVPPEQFLRGNARGAFPFNALLDALYILQWQFSMGPEPPCWNAADADGNNVINALIDALYILQYQFSMGPAPPAPGPDVCGSDPDGLDVLVGGVPTTPCASPPAYCNP